MVCRLGKERLENIKKNPCRKPGIVAEASSLTGQHDICFYRVKGHVNPDHPNTDTEKLYRKFVEWNGEHFTYEDFIYITKMNNRADELANRGMDPLKTK